MAYPAEGGIGRILGDRHDPPECFLPLPSGHRPRSILAEAINRLSAKHPTSDERERYAEEARQTETAKLTELRALVDRHAHLVATTTHPALTRLLTDHAPQIHEGSGHADCHYCGAGEDTDVWSHLTGTWVPSGWPCGVWTTINETSPPTPPQSS